MRRRAIGVLAIVLLLAGAALLIGQFAESAEGIGASCLRMGVLLALVWLAEPQLRRLPAWVPAALIALTLILAIRPKLFPVALAIVALFWLIRPKARANHH